MKAIVIEGFGGIETLKFQETERPIAKEGEVLVRIKASGVNPVDTKIRQGLLQSRMPNHLPIILGWEFSGIVEDTGFSARRFMPGDEVYAYARRTVIQNGTYAEYIALPESYLTYKPENIRFEEAAAVPLSGLTAYQSLVVHGKIQKKQHVVILGASGGVGSFAIQFAKIIGATVYAIAGKGREAYLHSLGADYIIDYSKGSVEEQIKAMLPLGADLVFDCVGKEMTAEAYGFVKENGYLVSILSQVDEKLIEKYKINFRYVFVEPDVKHLDILTEWIEQGKIKVFLQKEYELRDAAEAHKQIETGHTQGKIVLKMPA